MIRTQIYLTEAEKAELASIAAAKGISQSDLIRQAVDDLLARQGNQDKRTILNDIAGIWAEHRTVPNVRKLRAGWKRRRRT